MKFCIQNIGNLSLQSLLTKTRRAISEKIDIFDYQKKKKHFIFIPDCRWFVPKKANRRMRRATCFEKGARWIRPAPIKFVYFGLLPPVKPPAQFLPPPRLPRSTPLFHSTSPRRITEGPSSVRWTHPTTGSTISAAISVPSTSSSPSNRLPVPPTKTWKVARSR